MDHQKVFPTHIFVKDISIYTSNLKKFEQAKDLLRETILSEREKRKKIENK